MGVGGAWPRGSETNSVCVQTLVKGHTHTHTVGGGGGGMASWFFSSLASVSGSLWRGDEEGREVREDRDERQTLCVYDNEELKLTPYTYKHWGRDTHTYRGWGWGGHGLVVLKLTPYTYKHWGRDTHTHIPWVGVGGAWPRGSSPHSLRSPAHSGGETRREEK